MSDPEDDQVQGDPPQSVIVDSVANEGESDLEHAPSIPGGEQRDDDIDDLSTVALLSKLVRALGEKPPPTPRAESSVAPSSETPAVARESVLGVFLGKPRNPCQARVRDIRDRIPGVGSRVGSGGGAQASPWRATGRPDRGGRGAASCQTPAFEHRQRLRRRRARGARGVLDGARHRSNAVSAAQGLRPLEFARSHPRRRGPVPCLGSSASGWLPALRPEGSERDARNGRPDRAHGFRRSRPEAQRSRRGSPNQGHAPLPGARGIPRRAGDGPERSLQPRCSPLLSRQRCIPVQGELALRVAGGARASAAHTAPRRAARSPGGLRQRDRYGDGDPARRQAGERWRPGEVARSGRRPHGAPPIRCALE